MTKWLQTLAAVVLVSIVAACSAAPATVAPTEPPTQVSAAPPAATPTAEPICPEATAGTELIRNEAMGYCLLFPDELNRIDAGPLEICLVPEGPTLVCHSARAFFQVSDAAGRSADQIAEEAIAESGVALSSPQIQRTNLALAGERAVVLEGLPGAGRQVLAVQEDRLYGLKFNLPGADPADVERFDLLYNTVIESFTFLPIQAAPEPTEASRGSAVVAYIKDGDVLVWEEATGQGQVVFDSGDVSNIEMSDDGQLLAFVRRTSSLWVVDRDGSNPRELVSDEQLRARLGASDTDDTDFPAMVWMPNSHRLLYTVTVSASGDEQGLTLLDVDTLASAEVDPVQGHVEFAPSPNGEHIAVGTQAGLSFFNVEALLSGVATSTPSAGLTGRGPFNLRAWTQDSSAVLVRGSLVNEGNFTISFTIWRVPINGTPAQALMTIRGDREELAPDGSVVSFSRGTSPGGVSSRFYVPLPENLGPLAVLPDAIGPWSPAGSAYVFQSAAQDALLPLCPNATQAIEVCAPPIRFGEAVRLLEWIDRERFVYVAPVPTRLILGSLNGSLTVIAEDLYVPPNAGDGTIAQGFDAVASTCRDDAEFVSDVTVPDGTHFAPNTLFQKTWRVRNTGTCAWDASYRLTFLSGHRMFGPRSAPLGDTVQPGEEVDVSVMLIAPADAGTYQGQWQLFAPDGTPFGTRPYVLIMVP